MIVAFILTMPRVGSWNGKWSGEGRIYARLHNVGTSQKAAAKYGAIAGKGTYWYEFSDGWAAQVEVRVVERAEAIRLRKASVGFAGYEWMIDSIIRHGKILNSLQEEQLRKEAVPS